MNYLDLATFVRETTARPPCDPSARAQLASHATALGLQTQVLVDVQQLWTPGGWLRPEILQDDATAALMWTTRAK